MPEKLSLESDVSGIKGVGPRKKQLLERLGIETVGGLLSYYPVRYKDRQNVIRAIDATEDRDSMVSGVLMRMQVRPISGGRTIVECQLKDDSCIFAASFFNMPYLRNTLKTGTEYVLAGRMKLRRGMRTWVNPEMTALGSERDVRGIIPVYRTVQGLSSQNLSSWMRMALEAADLSGEWIDQAIVGERRICSREYALRNIHFPAGKQQYKVARFRLMYEELLSYQLAVRLRRKALVSDDVDASVPETDMSLFYESLPFALTEGQEKCIEEIGSDLSNTRPMNRLVQGDVGCGKTVVAEAAIYRCARAGLQSAMMAPTAILAKQHYDRLTSDLAGYGIRVVTLVSGMKASERRETLAMIADGTADVVVGTHAIIQEDVIFHDLALVITDEQHRFGVNQRKLLARKGRGVNVCVMSATPIPRTMAATVFGDMDFSIIRSMPAGRRKIITRVLDRTGREKAYSAVRSELDAGNQAYVIAPSIDAEDDDMSSVIRLYEEVRSRFRDCKVALLHGRMGQDEKDAVMQAFASGDVKVLVSTIVIEVGIDVPQATIMVIENSERFGLAQMHQLRGRVGRSSRQSYCYLINYSDSDSAAARARAMAEISDGFEISEVDYRLRGPGDLAGTMQSGNGVKGILELSGHTEILEAAITDADRIMEDPSGTDLTFVTGRMDRDMANDNSDVL